VPDAEPGCSADHGGAPRADTNSQKSVPKYIYIYNDKIEDFSEFVAVFGRLDRGREDAGELEHDTRAHLSFDEDLGGVVIHVEPATDATYVRQEQVLQTKKNNINHYYYYYYYYVGPAQAWPLARGSSMALSRK